MLRLLAVLPVKEYYKLSRSLVFASVNRLDVVLPRARRRLPRPSLDSSRRRCRVQGMAVSLRSLVGFGGSRSRFPSSLLRLYRLIRLFDYPLSTAEGS